MNLIEQLSRRQLLVVTGKGGVGKTVVSATLGRALAAAGRRTLVVEVDPRENLHQMMGTPPSGGDIMAAEPRLWVQNLKPQQVLDQVVREQLKLELLTRRVLDSPIYQQFAAGAPGLKEIAILGHAYRLLHGIGEPGTPEIDTVILDAPATGHGVTLLAAPALVSEVITNGPFARMAADLATLIADPERCGVVVVTQAEEMPVEEALELRDGAPASGCGAIPSCWWSTACIRRRRPSRPRRTKENELVSLWRRRRQLNERELARLKESWQGPRVELPQLPLDRGPALLGVLGRCLAESARRAVRKGREHGADLRQASADHRRRLRRRRQDDARRLARRALGARGAGHAGDDLRSLDAPQADAGSGGGGAAARGAGGVRRAGQRSTPACSTPG